MKNGGAVAGDEVVQIYVVRKDDMVSGPRRQLIAFERVPLSAGESKVIEFKAAADSFAASDDQGTRSIHRGELVVTAGGRQPYVCASLPSCSNLIEKTIVIGDRHPKRMH